MSAVALLAVALCAFSPPNQDDVGGPLRLRNEFPFQNIFMSTPPIDARIPRHARVDLDFVAANVIAFPNATGATTAGQQVLAAAAAGQPQKLDFPSVIAEARNRPGQTFYVVDTEVWRVGVRVTKPFGRRWLLEAEVPIYGYGGGFMDWLVEAYHQTMGFEDNGRHFFPHNLSQIGYVKDNAARYTFGQQGPGLGDITLRGMYNLTPEHKLAPATSVSAAVKLPSGPASKFFGSGTWDGGLGLHLTKHFGQSWLYGTAGYNFHGGWRGMPGAPVRNSFDLHLGYEYRVSDEWSVVTGGGVYGSPLRSTEANSINEPAVVLALAARFTDGRRYELEWGFLENLFQNYNTHDFGIYGRIRFWPWAGGEHHGPATTNHPPPAADAAQPRA